MKYKQGETGRAYAAAGWRERYAMENGKPSICYPNGHKCIKYNYGKKRPYQDANGATWDTIAGRWID